MTTDESRIPKIYEAMAAVMAEIPAIGKEKQNAQQGFKYRGIDDVYNAINPIMARHGIFMTPEVVNSQRDERTSSRGSSLIYAILTIKYTFYASDGSSVSCIVQGEGMDSGDKASNKAMSIAQKYALFQVFCIPTEEMPDPDAESHEVQPKAQQQSQPPRQEQPDHPSGASPSEAQRKKFFATLRETYPEQSNYREVMYGALSARFKRKIESFKDLTAAEMSRLISDPEELRPYLADNHYPPESTERGGQCVTSWTS